MNQRIRPLAEQANIHFSCVGILDGDPDGTARYVGYAKMEKLVELIVTECANIAYNKQYKHSPAHTTGDCAQAIREHFGVDK